MLEKILDPWPWYVVGPLITLTMLTMVFLGKSFGVSSNLKTFCAIGGAGKFSAFFRFDWRQQRWNLVFILGIVLGAWLSTTFLTNDTQVPISDTIVQELTDLGINKPGEVLAPEEIFSWEGLKSIRGVTMMLLGGFLIGFGTRYAGGCTSGHAISGLSNLQLPSLLSVIGFFAGGLTVTHLVLPWLLQFD